MAPYNFFVKKIIKVLFLFMSFYGSNAMGTMQIHCRDLLLKTAKDLVDNAKALVAGAASNQEHLMSAANTVAETIARMANCVKLGATSLGSHQPDAQVTLSVIILPVWNAGDRCASDIECHLCWLQVLAVHIALSACANIMRDGM